MPLTKIQSLGITDGTIVNADINASAAIAGTKISGSFGKVLQVVTATDSTERSTTSTSFVTADNTLSVSITPSSASSKVFITSAFEASAGASGRSFFTIYRDSTNLGNTNGFFTLLGSQDGSSGALSVLDSPSTTSAITYQVYIKSNGVVASMTGNTVKSTITAFEIGA